MSRHCTPACLVLLACLLLPGWAQTGPAGGDTQEYRVRVGDTLKLSVVGELERLHSHLLWVGLAGHFLGFNTVWMWSWRSAEITPDVKVCRRPIGLPTA